MTLPRPASMAPKSRPKRVGKAPQVGQPKVFGCALEDYIEVSTVLQYFITLQQSLEYEIPCSCLTQLFTIMWLIGMYWISIIIFEHN